MDAEYLVQMVNDIGNFFAPANPPAQAAKEIAAHIRRSWDPRMRQQIVAVWRAGAVDLSDVGRAAVELLAADPPRGG
jgi:formate dehydrogenase subunit delta